MPDRPPAGKVEVAIRHNAATDRHTFTCTTVDLSMLQTPGRDEVGLKLDFVDGQDAQGGPVLQAFFATFAWALVRPHEPGADQ
jgi:hypothetical protein